MAKIKWGRVSDARDAAGWASMRASERGDEYARYGPALSVMEYILIRCRAGARKFSFYFIFLANINSKLRLISGLKWLEEMHVGHAFNWCGVVGWSISDDDFLCASAVILFLSCGNDWCISPRVECHSHEMIAFATIFFITFIQMSTSSERRV